MQQNFETLARQIATAHRHFSNIVQKQINSALTMRNWLIGHYIVFYEQAGEDRAAYGEEVLPRLAKQLKQAGIAGMGETNLKLFRQFCLVYPHIGQTVSDELQKHGHEEFSIRQTVSDELREGKNLPAETLFSRLSFSHIIELLKANSDSQRKFYEQQVINNTWSVRELQRSMNSLLYERTGLSQNPPPKPKFIEPVTPEEVFRNSYVLEFLGLQERPEYSESDLEQSIIDNLQAFLIEMGKGFCFEARQKRIAFGNTHYRIDLVFYHRILKCHVLIDLKLGEFTHADSGQMNVYLNYYRENEMAEGDQPPIGIILCANQDENLVKYATGGLAQKIFVSKYMVDLPSEDQLKKILIDSRSDGT